MQIADRLWIFLLLICVTGAAVTAARSFTGRPEQAARADRARGAFFSVVPERGAALRRSGSITLLVGSGSGIDDAARAEALNAPMEVTIDDRPEAVVIRVVLRAGTDERETCRDDCVVFGVGQTLRRQITLPTPIGRRALVNAAFVKDGALPSVVLSSVDPVTQGRLSGRGKLLRYLGLDDDGEVANASRALPGGPDVRSPER